MKKGWHYKRGVYCSTNVIQLRTIQSYLLIAEMVALWEVGYFSSNVIALRTIQSYLLIAENVVLLEGDYYSILTLPPSFALLTNERVIHSV